MSIRGLILSVNKPRGWTSFDVVNKIRGTLRWKRVGHAGTLDPEAEGVLIVLCGSETRRSAEFVALPKQYQAVIRFGMTTTTDDLSGDVISTGSVEDWSEARVVEAFTSFRGRIEQVPPAVSAIKINGRRSYELARRGRFVSLAPRQVDIYALEVTRLSKPDVEVAVTCARGTYVRSLARDVGAQLGWGGVLAKLVRTAVGPYKVASSLTVDTILKRAAEFRYE